MHENLTQSKLNITTPEEANMDFVPTKEREVVIDIDRFIDTGSREVGAPALADEKIGNVVSFMPESVDGGENLKPVNGISPGTGKNSKREKGKPIKKSPKPPRPPRGLLSLDAADQKLIKEISELAMIKRARNERVKKMRAAKASASSTSSGGNLMAILFTIVFFGLIMLQGCRSSHGSKSSVPIQGSAGVTTVEQQNMLANGVPLTNIGSHNIMQPVPSSDRARGEAEKSVH